MAPRIKSSSTTKQSTSKQMIDSDLNDEDLDRLLNAAKLSIASKEENDKTDDQLEKIKQSWKNLPKLNDSNLQMHSIKKQGVVRLTGISKDEKSTENHTQFRKIVDPVQTRKLAKAQRESTAGQRWFDMPKTEMTPEIKRDMQILKMRNVLDPKRHYRKDNTAPPKYFQMGTIIEGNTEFYSARLTKKERKKTLAEEILADSKARSYFKKKYGEIQRSSRSGRKGDWKKRMAMRHK